MGEAIILKLSSTDLSIRFSKYQHIISPCNKFSRLHPKNHIAISRTALDIDDCDPDPCAGFPNSVGCVDGVDSYTCTCAPGYTGSECEIGMYGL